ncbi:hypothetical protein B0H11DRAFT_2225371 [Mycena galericulata]|nr:hypothetical protein B0H11DRAFT_2225371 [Mycena galericulata]
MAQSSAPLLTTDLGSVVSSIIAALPTSLSIFNGGTSAGASSTDLGAVGSVASTITVAPGIQRHIRHTRSAISTGSQAVGYIVSAVVTADSAACSLLSVVGGLVSSCGGRRRFLFSLRGRRNYFLPGSIIPTDAPSAVPSILSEVHGAAWPVGCFPPCSRSSLRWRPWQVRSSILNVVDGAASLVSVAGGVLSSMPTVVSAVATDVASAVPSILSAIATDVGGAAFAATSDLGIVTSVTSDIVPIITALPASVIAGAVAAASSDVASAVQPILGAVSALPILASGGAAITSDLGAVASQLLGGLSGLPASGVPTSAPSNIVSPVNSNRWHRDRSAPHRF